MLFVVYGKDKPGTLRRELRAEHLSHILRHPHRYRFGGPLIDDAGKVIGSLILMEVEDRAELERALAADPYFRGGLYGSLEIHATRQVIPELASGQLLAELEKERAANS